MSPQVLALGLPRSGTQSVAEALQTLGFFQVYHMREVAKHRHQDKWARLLDMKYSNSEDVPISELDDILGNFDAVTDFPATLFISELLETYPGAKVILLIRDKESWVNSMSATLVHAHMDPRGATDSPMRPLANRYHHYCWHDDFAQYGEQFYDQYLQAVRSTVTEDRLLEYRVTDGWDPLSTFLGKEAPNVSFPRQDDWAAYKIDVEKRKEEK